MVNMPFWLMKSKFPYCLKNIDMHISGGVIDIYDEVLVVRGKVQKMDFYNSRYKSSESQLYNNVTYN